MMEKTRLARLRAPKIKPARWLDVFNVAIIGLSFIGLVFAFNTLNSLAITAFGLGFVAALSFEVWRSCLNLPKTKEPTKKRARQHKGSHKK
ncbi:MAG: hypothetical protein ACTSSA_09915 [Candidatus Freyarchaeota archaeon]